MLLFLHTRMCASCQSIRKTIQLLRPGECKVQVSPQTVQRVRARRYFQLTYISDSLKSELNASEPLFGISGQGDRFRRRYILTRGFADLSSILRSTSCSHFSSPTLFLLATHFTMQECLLCTFIYLLCTLGPYLPKKLSFEWDSNPMSSPKPKPFSHIMIDLAKKTSTTILSDISCIYYSPCVFFILVFCARFKTTVTKGHWQYRLNAPSLGARKHVSRRLCRWPRHIFVLWAAGKQQRGDGTASMYIILNFYQKPVNSDKTDFYDQSVCRPRTPENRWKNARWIPATSRWLRICTDDPVFEISFPNPQRRRHSNPEKTFFPTCATCIEVSVIMHYIAVASPLHGFGISRSFFSILRTKVRTIVPWFVPDVIRVGSFFVSVLVAGFLES